MKTLAELRRSIANLRAEVIDSEASDELRAKWLEWLDDAEKTADSLTRPEAVTESEPV